MRPINDILQTLPQLVYIIPIVYLMPNLVRTRAGRIGPVRVSGRRAARRAGHPRCRPHAVEAAGAFGATRRQVLLKVKIPLAREAIMLGVNQGIIMVLAVVVIGGLVGSGALGYEVVQGLQRKRVRAWRRGVDRNPRSRIALDRVTQGNRRGRQDGGR